MVKWIHIADVHLGASPDAGDAYSKVRPQELWDTFAEAVSYTHLDVYKRQREQRVVSSIASRYF